MNKEVASALELFCTMIPNLQSLGNPNDDRRLYLLAKECYLSSYSLSKNELKTELLKNSRVARNSEEQLNDFIDTVLSKINLAKHIFKSIDL